MADDKKKIDFKNLQCEEASPLSRGGYIPCGRPAITLIWHQKDRRAYRMCIECASHNLHNRGGIELTEKE